MNRVSYVMAYSTISFILHGKRCPHGLPDDLLRVFSVDHQVDIHITTSSLSATDAALAAVKAGCDYLIAVGGDGTIHEVINGVMQAPEALRRKVVVGVLPFGSGNDFVRTLGVGSAIRDLHTLIRDGAIQTIDLGVAELHGSDGVERIEYFDNIASLGMGSAIVEKVNRRPAWVSPSVAFHSSIVSTLLTWRPQAMELRLDGGDWVAGRFQAVCVANGRFFASGLGVAPQANVADGRLEVVLIHDAGVRDFVRFLPALKRAETIDSPKISYLTGTSVEVRGVGVAPAVEADGEYLGRGNVTFRVLPAALRCLARQT